MRSVFAGLLFLCTAGSVLAAQAAHLYPSHPSRSHGLDVHADYDSQFDKTVLRLEPVALDSTLGVSALVALDGREVRTEAPGVVLTFWSTASAKPFEKARNVSLQLEDQSPLDLGAAYLTPKPRAGYSEILMKSLSLEQWLALANADRATLTIGKSQFRLSAALLAAIRGFASRMAPAGGK